MIPFFSCSSTKTTKVNIEVGVNDYTKSKILNNTPLGPATKTKGLDTGVQPHHAAGTNPQHHINKKHH